MKLTNQQYTKRKSPKNNYQLKRDEQDIVWVSIQPLMRDVTEHIKLLSDLDISNLDKFDQRDYDIKLLGLNSIYSFLGALMQEIELKELQEKQNGD